MYTDITDRLRTIAALANEKTEHHSVNIFKPYFDQKYRYRQYRYSYRPKKISAISVSAISAKTNIGRALVKDNAQLNFLKYEEEAFIVCWPVD